MVADFEEFSRSIYAANETTSKALRCAIFVLRQASELPASQRRAMIEAVKELISIKECYPEEES